MSFSPERPIPVSCSDISQREPLAVIGIGCRLPGGINSPSALWSALLEGVDGICDVPKDRWKHSRFHDTNPEKSGSIRNARGGFLSGVDQFDAEFFGYFPTEAQRIDPQQRMLLEVTYEAMEDAGLRRDQLDGSRTSVYVGAFMYDYLCIQQGSEQRDEINPYVAMGTDIAALANRISYDFNLKGPSISLDTACSSSLVALHLACRSLWGGEADMAIAAGVNLMLRPESSIVLSKAGFLNPDQYCKSFDAAANGYVRGEGVGVVILKPLSRAIADGDAIYACVHGTSVNQDGYLPEGFTVPNVFAQVALLETVYTEAGIDPLTVDYVEAHGTGTPVGDPIESLALGAVLGRNRVSGEKCLIGSVKTNLGHLEGAAGIAGFIKGVLTACHGVVPPNLHFHEPNPEIDWENLNLEVPVAPAPLKDFGRPRTVGVNSFGAGGTNAHVILQSHITKADSQGEHSVSQNGIKTLGRTLYVLSSPSRDALRALALRHADFLAGTPDRLDDAAFSAFTRRTHHPHLLAVVGESANDVVQQLRSFAEGQAETAKLTSTTTRRKEPKLAFVFSGQGGQWPRMGLQLMEREPIFRHWMERIDQAFQQLAGWSLIEEISREEGESKINETVVVQPAVMAVQISLVKLYEHYGIHPEGIVGHSIGEVAAAFASGALTLEQAVQVIFHRSQAQNLASGHGGMLAIGLSPEETKTLIAGYDGQVCIGAINGPEMLTLSGDTIPLQRIAEILEARGIFNRPVRVQVAYHSHHMESIKSVMLETLAQVQGGKATTRLYSTVTGRREDGLHFDAEYWFRNARNPVVFTDAVAAMLKDGYDTFVEIGPHPVLVSGAESLFKKLDSESVMIPAMNRRDSEVTVFLQSLARLAARGLQPQVEKIFGSGRRCMRLPAYPWQHSRHWFETPAAAEMRQGRFEHPFLKRQTSMVSEDGLAVWEATLGVHKFPWLRDHRVDGEIVVPATGHLELACAVAREQFRHESFFLENIHFDLPLIVPDNSRHPLEVRLEIVSAEGDYRICSRPGDASSDSVWTRHSSGRINTLHDRFDKSPVLLEDLRQRFDDTHALSVDDFYETIGTAGLEYGQSFRCIEKLWHQGDEMLAQLQLPHGLLQESQRNAIHPTVLDACLHVVFADVHRNGDPGRVYLPYRIDRIRYDHQPTQILWAYVRAFQNDEQYLGSDTLIFDESGRLICELRGLICKRLVGAGGSRTDSVYDGCYEYRWVTAPHQAEIHHRMIDYTTAVLVADDSPVAVELAARLTADGIKSQIIRFDDERGFDVLLENVLLDRRTLLIFGVGLSSIDTSWKDLASCPAVPSLLQLAQTLFRRQGVPRLCLVTKAAAGVDDDRQLDLGQAVLHGMSRVIRNECPQMTLTVIDVGTTECPVELDALYQELLHRRLDIDESEIALRGNQRYLRQLIAVDRDAAEERAASEESGIGGNYRAEVRSPGSLDQIVFRRKPYEQAGDHEVEIEVHAAGVNFKDVMNAMGLLPENAVAGGLTAHRLGLEVAGRVLSVGRLIQHVQVGDDVIARVPEGFCGRVITPGHCVTHRPQHLTPVQAAGIPVVFITAWYSLHHLARIAAGETVLIHSAAGGVGGAAIQLAHRAGATVIATAGTKEKRSYLQQQGVEHVFDSRSIDFYNGVMEVTGGRGVDIVLNSLTGRFITQSLKCLAPFGRFVELGKSDVYRNSKLGLERLGDNISWFVVDVDRLALQKPELHQQILINVFDLFKRDQLKPDAVTEFPISRLSEALRFMTRSAYHGKIVLNMQNVAVRTLPSGQSIFRPDRTYLITGGASGFGLEVARWMAKRGAKYLVLLSRSGPKNKKDMQAIKSLTELTIAVLIVRADITNRESVQPVIEQIKNDLPPLGGIIHGAAVMDDASISAMSMNRFEGVFSAKAQGAWNLHELTSGAADDLEFFLMLSSISSVIGFVGQINYASANFFQDALSQYRRKLHLPATSINLGVLGDFAGLSRVANQDRDIIGLLANQGLLTATLKEILSKLEVALFQKPVQRMIGRFDWAKFRIAYPHLAQDLTFTQLLNNAATSNNKHPKVSTLRETLRRLDASVLSLRLENELKDKLANILGVAPEEIDTAVSLNDAGLDSLMLTDLQIWILRMLDIAFPLIKLLKGPSIAGLTSDLVAQLISTESGASDRSNRREQRTMTFTWDDLAGIEVVSPWLVRGLRNTDAPFRLVCFHSMGVGASLFTNFLLNPPNEYETFAVQTPGRENRDAEPFTATVHELVAQILPHILPLFDRPVVIWGHSFGGIVALEVVRSMRDNHQLEICHFVVTGTMSPHLIHLWQNREGILKAMIGENSPEYLLSLSRYVDDPEFLKRILPLMRHDWPILQTYSFEPLTPLACPITAVAARQDDMVYSDEICEWSQHTSGTFQLIEVDGDHWFLNRNQKLIMSVFEEVARNLNLTPEACNIKTGLT